MNMLYVFSVTGVEITNFKGTVSEYLESHSPNIVYKVVDRSKLHVQEVNRKGIAGGVRSIPIKKSTTIGQICDEFRSKHAQVVKIKNGLIQEVVASDTKAADLVDDGYAYRIDLYPTAIHLTDDDDTFNVCVKFMGDSPEGRLKVPVLVKYKSGHTLNSIGFQVFSLLGMTNMDDVNDFQYSIDGKFIAKEHVLNKPIDPESIPVVLLNMNQNKARKPSFSYKKMLPK